MEILISLIIIAITFYTLSEVVDKYFIKSLDNISRWLKLTPSVAGATLLAFGTSAPEISTALIALNRGGDSISTGVGTIVGSAIFQILVVIGFAAAVKTSYLDWRPVVRDGVFYAYSVGLLVLFVQDGKFDRLESVILVGSYFLYLILLFVWTKFVKENDIDFNEFEIAEEDETKFEEKSIIGKIWFLLTWPINKILSIIPDATKKPGWTIPVFIISLAIIGAGSYFMVNAAETLAIAIGIPTAIVALTVLAGGTSIPEVISSAVVSKQGRGDMAIANAIGSNIFDILMSLGLPVLIYTFTVGDLTNIGGSNITSSILLLFITLLAVLLLLASQRFKASRPFGFFLIFLYVIYVFAAYGGWI